nr:MAG: hypothetical protein [Bacteriophage sp.]
MNTVTSRITCAHKPVHLIIKKSEEGEEDMDNRYFTVQELQSLKFYELPNSIYSQILSDLVHLFGVMTDRMLNTFNNSSIEQLDQYVDIYKYIYIL